MSHAYVVLQLIEMYAAQQESGGRLAEMRTTLLTRGGVFTGKRKNNFYFVFLKNGTDLYIKVIAHGIPFNASPVRWTDAGIIQDVIWTWVNMPAPE